MTSPLSAPAATTVAPLLELRNVSAGYGPFRAIFDVSLQLEAHSVRGAY